jgi:protein TonB
VPPPEVTPPPTAIAIPSVQTPPPEMPKIAPPPPPAAPAAPARQDVASLCPKVVEPKMPVKALREGVSGVVRVTAVIRGGKVADVSLTGPSIFHSAVREALSQYQCVNLPNDLPVVQEIAFTVQ